MEENGFADLESSISASLAIGKPSGEELNTFLLSLCSLCSLWLTQSEPANLRISNL